MKASDRNECVACMGRGWSWVSSRVDLLVARRGSGRGPERKRERCTECGGVNRAEVA